MARKTKLLGIILAAVLAMTVAGGSLASATPTTEFHATTAGVAVTGTQTTAHVMTANAGQTTCAISIWTGQTPSTTSKTLTLTPDYTNCKAYGFINVPVHHNGCVFNFNANGTTDLICQGAGIQVTAPGCTTTIGTQHMASGMTYTTVTEGGKRHITAHTSITGIKYDECGTPRTNGIFTGTTTIKTASGELWAT